jgi:hypothetical protein
MEKKAGSKRNNKTGGIKDLGPKCRQGTTHFLLSHFSTTFRHLGFKHQNIIGTLATASSDECNGSMYILKHQMRRKKE